MLGSGGCCPQTGVDGVSHCHKVSFFSEFSQQEPHSASGVVASSLYPRCTSASMPLPLLHTYMRCLGIPSNTDNLLKQAPCPGPYGPSAQPVPQTRGWVRPPCQCSAAFLGRENCPTFEMEAAYSGRRGGCRVSDSLLSGNKGQRGTGFQKMPSTLQNTKF